MIDLVHVVETDQGRLAVAHCTVEQAKAECMRHGLYLDKTLIVFERGSTLRRGSYSYEDQLLKLWDVI